MGSGGEDEGEMNVEASLVFVLFYRLVCSAFADQLHSMSCSFETRPDIARIP